jgi:hypothetical protein
MRIRLLAAMTAAILAMPLLSAAADVSSADHHCDTALSSERKCDETKG